MHLKSTWWGAGRKIGSEGVLVLKVSDYIMYITAFLVIRKLPRRSYVTCPARLALKTASVFCAAISQLQPFLQRAGRSTKLVAAHGVRARDKQNRAEAFRQ